MSSIENIPELRTYAMETLCALICELGSKYMIFVPIVSRTLTKCQYNYLPYDSLIAFISLVSESRNVNKRYVLI